MCFQKIVETFKSKGGMKPQEIDAIVTKELRGKLSNIRQVCTPDTEYNSVPKSLMEEILKKTDDRRYGYSKYEKLVLDCDDFALLLQAEVIRYAWKSGKRRPMAVGQVWGKIKVEGKWTNHAVNWFIDDQKEVWFLEPQTDEIFKPTDNKVKDIYYLRM